MFPESEAFQPKSLLYHAQLKIYHLLYNIIELVQSNRFGTVFILLFLAVIPSMDTKIGAWFACFNWMKNLVLIN